MIDVGALYEQHAASMSRYIDRRLYRHMDAEDVAASIWERVLVKHDMYEDRGLPIGAWLYRVAGNYLVDYLRVRKTRHQEHVAYFGEMLPDQQPSATDRDPFTYADLYAAILELEPRQRQAICLRYLEGLKISETAAAMGNTEDAVKKLSARALVQLKKILTDTPRKRRVEHRNLELPPEERADLMASMVASGMTRKQVAMALGTSVAAVNGMLNRRGKRQKNEGAA